MITFREEVGYWRIVSFFMVSRSYDILFLPDFPKMKFLMLPDISCKNEFKKVLGRWKNFKNPPINLSIWPIHRFESVLVGMEQFENITQVRDIRIL